MKGVIFTEFVDYVTERYGLETANGVIDSCGLASGGAYTAVGDYDAGELDQMLIRLSELNVTPLSMLMRDFGHKLFFALADQYPRYVVGADAFDLLASINEHIHVEVRKLYPDAVLPEFTHRMLGPGQMLLVYKSKHGMADLIEGLIQGCFDYFNEEAIISRQDLSGGMGAHVRFTLRRIGRER